MKALNETVFMREYMLVTECSEAQARSVYMFIDTLDGTDAAEDFDAQEIMPCPKPAAP